MTTDLNPHSQQMADESMVRTLEAQARAIWPQESELIRRYGLPDGIRILDVGCGTGEGASRLAEMFPRGRGAGGRHPGPEPRPGSGPLRAPRAAAPLREPERLRTTGSGSHVRSHRLPARA